MVVLFEEDLLSSLSPVRARFGVVSLLLFMVPEMRSIMPRQTHH